MKMITELERLRTIVNKDLLSKFAEITQTHAALIGLNSVEYEALMLSITGAILRQYPEILQKEILKTMVSPKKSKRGKKK